ncbi:hypothetical protein V492_06509 [Pseudogymnoascus sp. VKM F-4246]|nr:hypothetical protein V492_06509 [Pseudogymnoascus sp. VKM F-4246]
MGTRHLICVFYNGRFVLAQYGQLDGYPEIQGLVVVQFLRDTDNITRLKQGLAHMYTPTAKEEEEMIRAINRANDEWFKAASKGEVSLLERQNSVYPSMSTHTSAGILEVVAKATAEAKVPIKLETEFIHDGLFCEWAYVIDLDEEVLEVYTGLEREWKGSSERFKDVDEAVEGFVPSLVKRFAFAELPEGKAELVDAINEAIKLRDSRLTGEKREGGGDKVDASAV